jgi:hypothetical protein
VDGHKRIREQRPHALERDHGLGLVQDRLHEALISIEDFEAVQALFGVTKRATRRTPKQGHRYLLAGTMRCGICGRRMQGHWNHGHAEYRYMFTDNGLTVRGRREQRSEQASPCGSDALIGPHGARPLA